MESKKVSKRVNLVSVKLIKEGSILYEPRRVSSPKDAFMLGKEFLIDSDREKLILVFLDNKNQPTSINTVSIGSLNSSIVHPREVFKVAILSNSESIIIYHNHPSGDVVNIEHTQEVRDYKSCIKVNAKDLEFEGDEKVYLIDSRDYSTMLLAEEY